MKRHLVENAATASTNDRNKRKSGSGDFCRRPATTITPRTRDVNVVYTDVFLDTFNYEHDWNVLCNEILSKGGRRKTLLVLSRSVYDTVRRNENNVVLRDGCCHITTPESFGASDTTMTTGPTHLFDAVVYFNVDPFVYATRSLAACQEGASATTTTVSGLGAVVSTPFVAAFDRYMMMSSKENDTDTTITIVFNTFLLRTESVTEYERSRELRVNFRPRVFPVHSQDRKLVRRTMCNFCSDAVLCMKRMAGVYIVQSDRPMPSTRALGSTVVETVLRPDRLVLLDVSANRGGQYAVTEYYRFKQFYYSFAHGRDNKWGLRLATGVSLHSHLQRWNAMFREELKRWYWMLEREAAALPADSRADSIRRDIMPVYDLCPCVLNSLMSSDRCVCGGSEPPQVASILRRSYVRDLLMSKFDTSTFNVCKLDDDNVNSLLATAVSVNDLLVVTTDVDPTGPSLKLEHNRFYKTMV